MTQRQGSLNLQYAAVQGFYWMGICVCISFAAVFLQHRGYSNSALGFVMACGNIAGFLLSPVLAALVDRSQRVGVFSCLWALLLLQGLLLLFFRLVPGRSTLLPLAYCLYMAAAIAVNPMITQLSLELEKSGVQINYGAARGTGSIAFAPTALLLGAVTERFGPELLPIAGLACVFFQCAMLLALSLQLRVPAGQTAASGKKSTEASSLPEFIRKNRRFCFLMLGVALLFFAHNLVNNYLINVVRNAGGNAASMGGLNAFMALMEVPAMFLYDRLSRRFSCPGTLRFAAVFFALKALCIALSASMGALYAAHLLQAFSFAVITPACVRYVNLYIDSRDSAKGQSISYGMTTLGSIFASSLGGLMFDKLSVGATLLVGAAVSALGAAVCLSFSKSQKRSA